MNKKCKNCGILKSTYDATGDRVVVDHINHNGLDNRKVNLRVCTNAQNLLHSRKNKGTRYKGVIPLKNGKFQVVAYLKHIGIYEKETEAVKAYNKAIKELCGEFAVLNIIKKD